MQALYKSVDDIIRGSSETEELAIFFNRWPEIENHLILITQMLLRSRIPAAFMGTRQQMPGNLETIGTASLARTVCGDNSMAATAA